MTTSPSLRRNVRQPALDRAMASLSSLLPLSRLGSHAYGSDTSSARGHAEEPGIVAGEGVDAGAVLGRWFPQGHAVRGADVAHGQTRRQAVENLGSRQNGRIFLRFFGRARTFETYVYNSHWS